MQLILLEAAALAIHGVDEGAVPQETQFTDSLADALKVNNIKIFRKYVPIKYNYSFNI